jgi:hypothetical protein
VNQRKGMPRNELKIIVPPCHLALDVAFLIRLNIINSLIKPIIKPTSKKIPAITN